MPRGYGAMRYELKYYLPLEVADDVRRFITPYVVHDPYCADLPGHRYTVRSIYLDTDDLRFYSEKLDSLNNRKKVRVRTYNEPDGDTEAFIEIKRKFGRLGSKDRLQLPWPKVDHALNGKDPAEVLSGRHFRDRKTLEKIRFLMHVNELRPTVLVAYEREAFVGREDRRVRVTFDQNIRSLQHPTLDQIFAEQELRQFEDDHFILELKFDNVMPVWMSRLIRSHGLQAESYSKYCQGIDAWSGGLQPMATAE